MSTMPTNAAAVQDTGAGPHNGREARNLAEKQRRDKLNASIQELATMVPHVAESPRRLDKTAVLRFAAHGLRLQYVFGKSVMKKQRNRAAVREQVAQPELSETLMQLLDSFFITLTCHGQIVVISDSVEQLLGHCQSDLYGQNILNITHPEDHELLLQQLIPNDMETLFRSEYRTQRQHNDNLADDDDDDDEMGNDLSNEGTDDYFRTPSPHVQAHLADIDERLRNDRRCFTIRLARAGTRSEATRNYEIVKIDGCFRRSDCSSTGSNFPIVSQLIRRSRGHSTSLYGGLGLMQHDTIAQAALHGISGNDIVLVAMARIIRPPKVINYHLDGNKLEYRTRHLIDGRIIDCDQRIGLVAGYMKEEVRNLSPFSFMHQDDVRWVIVALRQMYDCNSDYGESCYRLLSRNGNFIYLQTKGYMEIEKSTKKVHSFVCVNTLLDEEEGRRRVQEMKNKFSVIIKTKIPSNSLQDVPASQNPQQLERIVLYLIENLQKRHENVVMSSSSSVDVDANDQMRYTRTPPLALVPPEPSSVRNSISKSVNIVNVTAARSLHNNFNNLKSPTTSMQSSDLSLSPTSSVETIDESIENAVSPTLVSSLQQHPSVLQTPFFSANVVGSKNDALDFNASDINENCSSTSMPLGTSVYQTQQPISKMLQQKISVLKRLNTTPATVVSDKSISPAKRCSSINQDEQEQDQEQEQEASADEIHSVLSCSLENLDQSLQNINEDAQTLCQQNACLLSPVPQMINQKLDAIFMEHQKQTEILVNIKNEYNVHMQQHHQQQQQQQQQQQLQQQEQQQHKHTVTARPLLTSYTSGSVPLVHQGKQL